MTKINIKPDCGNAPKKAFLKDFNIAFAKGDVDFIKGCVSNDIEWEIYGDQQVKGKEAFDSAVTEMANYKAKALTIHHIITHGKEAAVNGEMVMDNNEKYAFCDVYEFTSTTKNIIKRMASYVMKNEFKL